MIFSLLKTYPMPLVTLKGSPTKNNQDVFEKQVIPGLGQEVYKMILDILSYHKTKKLLMSYVHIDQLQVLSTSLKIGQYGHNRLIHIKTIKMPEFVMIPKINLSNFQGLLGHQFIFLKTSREKEIIYSVSSGQRVPNS